MKMKNFEVVNILPMYTRHQNASFMYINDVPTRRKYATKKELFLSFDGS